MQPPSVPDAPTDLPPNWVVNFSTKHQLPYYYNVRTGQSLWTPPEPEIKMRASHILVKHNESRRPSSWKSPRITRSLDDAMQMIENYRHLIATNQVTFEKLATTESDCNSAKKGGDLNWFSRGQMQPPFEKAVLALKVGELSGPVLTDSGVHLILRTG
ncbi:Peptidyl-prolyl cis-trans isomerase NIMA-interacting protein 1 [Spiromyces aspiralis]|uniref:Peptidyl-prolyl cis-trans isomerase NIMA-interacting protein 1 n=1 Tax=Spiromyces aspiralis TaxID=68401 RepID=A0ACC1HUP8_9FUNG|nr:Peptidyl-prolyl cis-trans isomerase NIMA-interacting protein 1 [Spiromyces aspiralis]